MTWFDWAIVLLYFVVSAAIGVHVGLESACPACAARRLQALVGPSGMMMYHTAENAMPKTKVAVTVDADLLDRVDELVAARRFANRSQAVERALADTVARLARTRLARECAKVDPREEQALAEEGFAGSRDTWPEY